MKTNRHSPLQLSSNKTLKNRVVVPPMASETADQEGFVSERTLTHYDSLASSGAGLVMVEYTYVHPSGKSEKNQLGLDHDDKIPGVSQISQTIRSHGALAGIQLTHAGGKTSRDLSAGALMAPSRVSVPVKDKQLEVSDEMDLQDIELWKRSFLSAAIRADQAGFDLVELHAAHGYGLNQWLSPLTNIRSDLYGVDKSKLLLEIVALIKKELPRMLLAVRIPGQDFLPEGLTLKETGLLAQQLEKCGVDLIDVSSGIGGWKRPRERVGQGYLTDEARAIQAMVSTPVIGVGGIVEGDFIDMGLQHQWFSLAAVGRELLKGPSAWGKMHLGISKT